MAPMEGLTTYTYRNAHHKYFRGISKYYTPFIAATANLSIKNKDKKDVAPKNNSNIYLVPQLLANNANDLVAAIEQCAKLGYDEVNLNLGCPSPTVVTKHKGSGLLDDLIYLDEMLDRTFKMMPQGMKLSVKTRLGVEDTSQARELIHLYNRYPISELIVHARVQKDYYKKPVRLDDFAMVLNECRLPVVYNGNILDVASYKDFVRRFPQVKTIMLGRGLIADPDLVHQLCTGEMIDVETLHQFMTEIFDLYKVRIDGVRNTLMRMKEIWYYLQTLFIFEKRDLKKILKAKTETDYKNAVSYFFDHAQLDRREKRDIYFR